jgi:thiol:disulfide interchange protein DsbD
MMRGFFFTRLIFCLAVAGVAAAWSSRALAFDDTASAAHAELSLTPSVRSVLPGQPFWAVLEMDLEDGWHVYWRNPGDSGFPVAIVWDLPDGFSAEAHLWPLPERIREADMVTYGYERNVTFLTRIIPAQPLLPGEPVAINAAVNFLACKLICVPGSVNLSLTFPRPADKPVLPEDEINSILSRVPSRDVPWEIEAAREPGALLISARVRAGHGPDLAGPVYFFPFESGIVDHAAEQDFIVRKNGFDLRVPLSGLFDAGVERAGGVLAAYRSGRDDGPVFGWEIDAPVMTRGFSGVAGPAGKSPLTVWAAVVFAFLGGIILNLMPCVLPVLSIKVLGLVRQAGESRGKVLQHGLAFAFGIVSAFWGLAGLLAVLRLAGARVGWGFQFQSPVFLVVMIFLFLTIALNFFGVFEAVPGLTRLSPGAVPPAGTLKGSFLNGVLATVVATPCTAPFMGTALGFALVQPVGVAWLVFTALGLGMALPYLLLTLSPALLGRLPKPGPWMVTMKQSFGFVLLGTVAWLTGVLGNQRGVAEVKIAGLGLVAFAFGIWLLNRGPGKKKALLRLVVAWALILGAFGYVVRAVQTVPPGARVGAVSGEEEVIWRTYSPELLEGLRQQGVPVFVDFTASWCLTCQLNKSTALGRPEVLAAFREKGVVLVRADWTSYDPAITDALAALGKTSIPVYLLYPAGEDEPLVLPELLTARTVYQYLDRL